MTKEEEQVRQELINCLCDMVQQHCYMDKKLGWYDSGALSSDAEAMRLLTKLGKFEIVQEKGRMVYGRFK